MTKLASLAVKDKNFHRSYFLFSPSFIASSININNQTVESELELIFGSAHSKQNLLERSTLGVQCTRGRSDLRLWRYALRVTRYSYNLM